jgi:hypothetical protein
MASCVHGVGGCLSLRRIQPRPHGTQIFTWSVEENDFYK